MNWNPFKKKKDESDPVVDFTLSDLKPGYVVDYDLKTWKVTAKNHYDFDGDRVDEWELTCADDVMYLEREEDDGLSWTVSRKIPISRVDGDPQVPHRGTRRPARRNNLRRGRLLCGIFRCG